jgi:ABC-type sugar transport system ATPase subunit
MAEVILQLSGVEKSYGALRPLRIGNFTLRDGESVALVGVDGPAAEVLVDVITGAVLPDRGEAVVFGSATTAPADGESWLRSLDRFGIFSQRAVLLDGMTVAQNLALPFSLELNPISDGVRQKVVRVERRRSQPAGTRTRAIGSRVGHNATLAVG